MTLSTAVFPFDYHFVFFLLGIICAAGLIVSLFIPKTINRPKPKDEVQPPSESTGLLAKENPT